MEISTEQHDNKVFKPFSVTIKFQTEEDVEATLRSFRDNDLEGTDSVTSVEQVMRRGYTKMAEIYYAIKCKGIQK